jgi:S1-C subfamily serine protease
MQFLTDILVAILSAYLALSNAIAGGILTYTGSEIPERAVETTPTEDETGTEERNENSLTEVASNYEYGGAIPNILIDNAMYQQAAIGASVASTATNVLSETLGTEARMKAAMVNVYCQHKAGGSIRTTSGSGFFISENGVLLTNAHIAQFLLFDGIAEIDASRCIIRGNDPAIPLYEAKLLYLPPMWITAHASLINDEKPQGTGERDYALLYISDALEGISMPESFPYLRIDTELLSRNTEGALTYAGGFPAKSIGADGPDAVLHPIVATTSVGRLFTFGSNYADLFSISESPVGEHGASGGPVTRADGSVIGLIVTKGNEESDGVRSLRAITLSYIDRTIREETGFSLLESTRGDLTYRAKVFTDALSPFLQTILSHNME